MKSKNTWNKIYFLFLTNSKNIVFIMLKKHAKWFFFVFMLKMVFLKKDIFMMIFFKTLPYFLSLFFPFLLLPDLSCHFFFSFSYMPGQSRVSTVLFALYLSLFFFFPLFLPLVGLCCLEAEVHTKAVLNWKGS